jgi:hypothetical protein
MISPADEDGVRIFGIAVLLTAAKLSATFLVSHENMQSLLLGVHLAISMAPRVVSAGIVSGLARTTIEILHFSSFLSSDLLIQVDPALNLAMLGCRDAFTVDVLRAVWL